MGNFWRIVNQVIEDADVLLLILDARMIDETRNPEIENKVGHAGKPLVHVITKCDLVDKTVVEKFKKTLNNCVFVSATKHYGTTMLRDKILIEAKRVYPKKKAITVGVLGYPNVGKSSIINALKGRKSAPTSILSGYTKGVQKVRADNRIMLLDTPGVIPYQEKDRMKHALIGTIDFNNTKEPDLVVMELMQRFPKKIESFYEVEPNEDLEAVIEVIAVKRNILKKGNVPDIMRTSRMILKDWQKGVIVP